MLCLVGGWGAAFFFRLRDNVPLPLVTSELLVLICDLELDSFALSSEFRLSSFIFTTSFLYCGLISISSVVFTDFVVVEEMSIFFRFTVEEFSSSSSSFCILLSPGVFVN